VLPKYERLDHLAGRIESAYTLRTAHWRRGCSTSRVWHAGAVRLWEAHTGDPSNIPLDPELFVASQPIAIPFSDPWTELAHSEATRRYRMAVRQIVRQLRAELRREVAIAERLIRRGEEINLIVGRKPGRISALGSYILARRAGCEELAGRLAQAAANQHQSCPLYRAASLALIPAEFYPDERLAVAISEPTARPLIDLGHAVHGKFRACCEN
jgi:hypothetical protein